MSRKQLILTGLSFFLVVNVAIVATLYLTGIIFQPSPEELDAQRLAEEEALKAAEDAKKYAHLEPLPEFKSRVGYVSSMGEAIDICERTLHEKEKARKTWAVNYKESRYLPEKELYLIFIDYETIPDAAGGDIKIMKATCDIDEPTKTIAAWKAMPKE